MNEYEDDIPMNDMLTLRVSSVTLTRNGENEVSIKIAANNFDCRYEREFPVPSVIGDGLFESLVRTCLEYHIEDLTDKLKGLEKLQEDKRVAVEALTRVAT
jgi:hypothetical protein